MTLSDILSSLVDIIQWRVHSAGKNRYHIADCPVCNRSGFVYKHRLLMGNPAGRVVVDHIDGDGLNNDKKNLRIVTIQQNLLNSKKRATASSRFKGVSWVSGKNKWRSYVRKDEKTIHIGYFKTEEEAARAYDKLAKELHGKHVRLNFQNIKE